MDGLGRMGFSRPDCLGHVLVFGALFGLHLENGELGRGIYQKMVNVFRLMNFQRGGRIILTHDKKRVTVKNEPSRLVGNSGW